MRNYETVIIIRPGLAAEAELTAIIDKYSGVINAHQGEIAGADRWGLKKLAYPIKKENQGFYIMLRFTCEPDGIKEMERLLRIDDRILKYLTVKLIDNQEPFSLSDEEGAGPDTDEESEENDDNEETA
ncbi:30S ribosomal protein S6 [Desulfurivibrio sp. C05AmB]|uniref:30S ribosomal protein S6 n=1 Tax=Desulfurivibrio sp. C05AmB TaxID=3374371 RepID=UPI00376ED515